MILQEIYREIIIAVVLAVGAYIANYFRKRGDCINKLNNQMEKLTRTQWRTAKTLLILAKLIDDQTKKEHPDIAIELEEIARELLSDNPK